MLLLMLVIERHQESSMSKSTITSMSLLLARLPVQRQISRAQHAPARVVEWQTRTFEGRMPKGMRVQVPPRAPFMSAPDVGVMTGFAEAVSPKTASCRFCQHSAFHVHRIH